MLNFSHREAGYSSSQRCQLYRLHTIYVRLYVFDHTALLVHQILAFDIGQTWENYWSLLKCSRMGDGGGGHCLVRMEWRLSDGRCVCLC